MYELWDQLFINRWESGGIFRGRVKKKYCCVSGGGGGGWSLHEK